MKDRSALSPLDLLQRYSVSEALQYLRTSRKTFYEDVKAGRIRILKDRRRSYVSGAELARRSSISSQV